MLLDEELYDEEENEDLIADQCCLIAELQYRLESVTSQYEDLDEGMEGTLEEGRLVDEMLSLEDTLHKLGVRTA